MRVLLLFLVLIGLCKLCFAQDTAATIKPQQWHRPPSAAQLLLDSIANAEGNRQQIMADSIAMQYINKPDSLRTNQFLAQILKEHAYTGDNFLTMPKTTRSIVREGLPRRTRDRGIILIIIGLVTYGALLNRAVSKDIMNVMESF